MKKITKTLMALFAIVLSISATNAAGWAPPTLQGGAIQPDTEYYLYNFGTESYLTFGGNWGTQAIMGENGTLITLRFDQESELYTLEFDGAAKTLFRDDANGFVYTDNAKDNQWNIQLVDANEFIYTIQIPVGENYYDADSYFGTTNTTYTTQYGSNSDKNKIVYDARHNRTNENGDEYLHWIFIDVALYEAKITMNTLLEVADNTTSIDLTSYIETYNEGNTSAVNTAIAELKSAIMAYYETTADEANPVDVTALYLTNPGFETGDFTGWDNTNMVIANNTGFALKEGTYFAEKWQNSNLSGSYQIEQTINDLYSGKYILKAKALSQNTSGNGVEGGAVLYAGDKETNVGTIDEYEVNGINVIDGTLTLGFKFVGGISWLAIDDFRLEYVGYDFTAVKEILAGLLEKASSIEDGHMGTTESTELAAAKQAAQDANNATVPSKDDLTNATSRLENAIAAAAESIDLYKKLKDAIDIAKTSDTTDQDELALLAEADALYNGKTTNEEEVDVIILRMQQTFFDSFLDAASEENPIDVTRWITNPSFETGDFTGWTNINMEIVDNDGFSLKVGDYFVEKYQHGSVLSGTYQIEQTLEGIVNGRYILRAGALSQNMAGGTSWGAALYAGDKETTIGNTDEYEVADIIVVDGKLTIGFKFVHTTRWLAVDNFRLEYLGYDVTAAKEALAALIEDVILLEEEYSGNSALALLSEAKQAANEVLEVADPSKDQLSDATIKLLAAIEAFEKAIFDEILANATEENPVDVTHWITNPSFEIGGFSGWENQGMQTQSNNSFGSKEGTYYVEKWDDNAISGTVGISQQLTNLPVGKYLLRAAAVAASASGEVEGAALYAGKDRTIVSTEQYYEVTTLVANGTLTIGFEFIGANARWIGVDDFTLYYLGLDEMEVSENNGHITLSGIWSAEQFEQIDNANITSYDITRIIGLTAKPETKNLNALFFADEEVAITGEDNVITADEANKIVLTDGYSYAAIREFTANEATFARDFTGMNGWATLYLPFAAELNGKIVEHFAAYDEENSRIHFEVAATIEPNTPYLLRVEEGTASQTFSNNGTVVFPQTLNPTTPDASNFTFQGTYINIPAGDEKLIMKADGSEFAVTSLSAVGPFRAYLTANDNNYSVRSLSIVHDGDDITSIATGTVDAAMKVWGENGILHIIAKADQTLSVYSISGSLIGKVEVTTGYNAINGLSKGVYIVNNRKVVIR